MFSALPPEADLPGILTCLANTPRAVLRQCVTFARATAAIDARRLSRRRIEAGWTDDEEVVAASDALTATAASVNHLGARVDPKAISIQKPMGPGRRYLLAFVKIGSGAYGTGNAATVSLSRLHGFMVERREIGQPGDFAGLSTEQVKEKIESDFGAEAAELLDRMLQAFQEREAIESAATTSDRPKVAEKTLELLRPGQR
jgi:hypothetical protein